MGGFLDFLNTVLISLFKGNDQDDPSGMHGAQDEACDYKPDVPDAYRYRH